MSQALRGFLVLLLLIVMGCSPATNEEFREAGRSISKSITQELQDIHSHDELVTKLSRLEKLFNRLVDVMLAARKHELTYNKFSNLPLAKEDHWISDQLRVELNRVFQIPGGKELVESAQQQALDKLDRFEQSCCIPK